jgi:Protein of unknown function (DUF1566)
MSATHALSDAIARIHNCDDQHPWPALLQYEEGDHKYFRGREKQVDELLRLVRRARLSVLFGSSGLGKSSLLKAGLFPVLSRENIVPIYVRFRFDEERPDLGAQVLQAIFREAPVRGVRLPEPTSKTENTLWRFFHGANTQFLDGEGRTIVLLLVLDQFEEVFSRAQESALKTQAVDGLFEQLSDLTHERVPSAVEQRLEKHPGEWENFNFSSANHKLVIAIREDYLPQLEERFNRVIVDRMRVPRMTPDEAMMVVMQAPELVAPDAAPAIVDVATESPKKEVVDPAMLSLFCYELNLLRGGGPITAGLVKAEKENILSKYCERAFQSLPQEVRTEVRLLVEKTLITSSGLHRDSFAFENVPLHLHDAIIELEKTKLIHIEGRRKRIELAHDRLVEPLRQSRAGRELVEARLKEEEAVRKLKKERMHKLIQISLVSGLALVAIVAILGYKKAQTDVVQKDFENERTKRLANLAYWVLDDPGTGLRWTREDNGYDVNWSEAQAYCNLGAAGWRVPAIDELEKIRKDGFYSWRGGLRAKYFQWSSSEDPAHKAKMYDFLNDRVTSSAQEYAVNHRVLCVCGPDKHTEQACIDKVPTQPVHVDTTQISAWVDQTTKLAWLEKDNGTDVNWHEADNFCQSKYGGWRLPNIDELKALYGLSEVAVNSTDPTGNSGKRHIELYGIAWSSSHPSSRKGGDDLAFGFDFASNGKSKINHLGARKGNRALCVRDPQSE